MARNFNFILAACVVLMATGCVSKREMALRQQQAYLAGEQRAIEQSRRQGGPNGPSVTVEGAVQHPVVAWSEGLTVTRAIATATYTAFLNPRLIQVVRNGEVIQEYKPIDLQQGYDMPVQPGDVIKVVP